MMNKDAQLLTCVGSDKVRRWNNGRINRTGQVTQHSPVTPRTVVDEEGSTQRTQGRPLRHRHLLLPTPRSERARVSPPKHQKDGLHFLWSSLEQFCGCTTEEIGGGCEPQRVVRPLEPEDESYDARWRRREGHVASSNACRYQSGSTAYSPGSARCVQTISWEAGRYWNR